MRRVFLGGALVMLLGADAPGDPPTDPTDLSGLLDAAEGAVRRSSGLDARPAALPQKDPRALAADARILQVGPGQWKIAAALRDWYAEDVSRLQELCSPVVRKGEDGRVQGWVLRLERFGLMHQAGFRNGDLVRAVNGHALTSIPAVLAAFRALRKEPRLVVELERRGRPVRQIYQFD